MNPTSEEPVPILPARPWSSRWPGLLAALLFLLLAGLLYRDVVRGLGTWIYALDDAYIHMTLGRTLADSGTWGLVPGTFASASSSPGWTVLMALGRLLHLPLETLPLALNLLFGILLLQEAEGALGEAGLPGTWRVAALCVLVLVFPMAPLALSGMEHLFHGWAVMGLLRRAVRPEHESGNALPWGLAAFAFIATSARYESLFLLAALAGYRVLVSRSNLRAATSLVALGALPVLAFGLYSLAHRGGFLPWSLQVKGSFPRFDTPRNAWLALGGRAWLMGLQLRLLPCLTALGALPLLRLAGPGDVRVRTWGAAVAGCVALHLQFAATGWFYRYEAYLVGLGTVGAALVLWELRGLFATPASPWRRAAGFAFAALLAATAWDLVARGWRAHEITPVASKNIRDQQFQTARLLARDWKGALIATDDIGEVAWEGQVRVLDLVGLADGPVMRAWRSGGWGPRALAKIAADRGDLQIAAVHAGWFEHWGGFPKDWIPVGYTRIRHNVVSRSNTVTFFAVAPGSRERLARSLAAARAWMPKDVEIGLFDVEEGAEEGAGTPRAQAP